ncbi:Helix-turn-helix domain-containing protein [Rhodospirillales bacterium URHD0017]|nr:Helix-turn-helix domain-containing protein [Rhodospirillales bacterium URHD0017]
MTTLGERVKTERRAKGWSQAELARRVTKAGYSITQGGIAQIERRGDTEPKSIVQLAQALGLSVNWLQSIRGDKTAGVSADDDQLSMIPSGGRRGRGAAASSPPSGPRQPLQVFASAQGGSEGAMILSNEPVSWLPRDPRLEGVADAYGCFVSGDSMEPAYEKGNILLVNPTARPEPGDDVVLMREDKDGQRYVLIKRLVKINQQSWTVKQYNPAKTFTLPRKEWSKAHLVIGKYNRAS